MNILSSKNRTLAILAALGLAATSASAAVVWDLNPNNIEGSAGSPTQTFTSNTYQITARGYDNNGGTGIAHDLFFKNAPENNGAIEHGLGLTNTLNNELQVNGGVPANFIQLDFSSILAQGFINGQLKVGSVQSGESFQLFGSNSVGTLGTSLGTFNSSFDDKFVAISDFGTFKFISVAAANLDVLPVAFEADITPVPEMSALLPIIGLLVAIGTTQVLRRRASARA